MEEFEKNTENGYITDSDAQSSRKAKNKRKLRSFAKICVVLILIITGIRIYNLCGCNPKTSENLFEFETGSNYQITEYKGDILALSYDGIKILRPNGTQKAVLEYNMANPHIDISGDMILLYDKDSNKMAVFDEIKRLYSFESDRKIRSARVNKNGYSVVVSDDVGYNSRITVVDKSGQIIYKWQIGDEYIVDVDISSDNKRLAAATITTETGNITENIIMVDIDKATETGRSKTEGTMPLQVKFTEGGNALVISDTRLCGYNKNAKRLWENSFESNLLTSFSTDEDGNTVVALRGIKNNSILKMYNRRGKNTGEYVTETQAMNIDISSKYVAVYEKGRVSLINLSGKCVSDVEFVKEADGLAVIGNDKAVLLCSDGIQLIRM